MSEALPACNHLPDPAWPSCCWHMPDPGWPSCCCTCLMPDGPPAAGTCPPPPHTQAWGGAVRVAAGSICYPARQRPDLHVVHACPGHVLLQHMHAACCWPRLQAMLTPPAAPAPPPHTQSRRLDEEPYETLVAAGGDGTLNELVAAMVRYGAPPSVSAALVPFGTANDFAAANGISQVRP